MMTLSQNYEFWFVVGSQSLYGEETLREVQSDGQTITDRLNS